MCNSVPCRAGEKGGEVRVSSLRAWVRVIVVRVFLIFLRVFFRGFLRREGVSSFAPDRRWAGEPESTTTPRSPCPIWHPLNPTRSLRESATSTSVGERGRLSRVVMLYTINQSIDRGYSGTKVFARIFKYSTLFFCHVSGKCPRRSRIKEVSSSAVD